MMIFKFKIWYDKKKTVKNYILYKKNYAGRIFVKKYMYGSFFIKKETDIDHSSLRYN